MKFAMPGMPYLLLAAFVAGSLATWRVMDWKHDAEVARELEVAIALQDDKFKIVLNTETVIQERVRVVERRGADIVKEVPVYVTTETDRAYPVPVGVVRLHDAAASGQPPGPAAQSDADPSSVTASRLTTTIGGNYTAYLVCREQVIGWNEFYAGLKARLER